MRVLQQQQSSSGNEEEGLFEKWNIQDATWGIPFLYLTMYTSYRPGRLPDDFKYGTDLKVAGCDKI